MSDHADAGDDYELRERLPTVAEFRRLRAAADVAAHDRAAVERGLPNSTYGVVVVGPAGDGVGMGRVVGDGGTVYHLSDVVVHPDHQGRGVGSRVMAALVEHVEATAPPSAYVNLLTDLEGFYERFGFEDTRPGAKAMYLPRDGSRDR